MSTALTSSIDGSYIAPATINVFFLDDGSEVGFENQGTITDAAGHTFEYDGWTAYEIQQAQLAFAQFSAVSNVAFNFVSDIAVADFIMVTGDNDDVGSLGYWNVGGGTVTVNGVDYDVDGVGVFNWEGQGWDFFGPGGGQERGGLGFVTLLDAIGRGLGLATPHDTDGVSTIMQGVGAPTGDYGDFDLNQGVYTIMSFNDGWHTAPHGLTQSEIHGWQGGPMALDIAVLQEKYGANIATNLGDTVYVLPDTNVSGTFYQAIWDVGGTDTIAYGGNGHATIDLRAATLQYEPGGGGFLSYVAGIHGGFTIANGAVIENATGGAGNDTLTGNDADNVLTGGPGADFLDGGAGNDTASYRNAAARVVASLADPSINQGEALGDIHVSIENLEGSDFDDRLVGNTAANTITGGAGNDSIAGVDGNDSLFGGAGDDSLFGGSGVDHVFGEAGADLLRGGPGDDILNGGDDDDRLFGGEDNDTLNGESGVDRVFGEAGDDLLHGGDGKDVLNGGSGNDQLFGGADNDKLYGGSGNDQLSGEDGNDLLRGGIGDDILDGGNGNDRLFGAADNDTLNGGAGNDQLFGEAGNDILTGGIGLDRFVFQPNGGQDRVTDFEDNLDLLKFTAYNFASKDEVLALAAQAGADVVFTMPDGGTIELSNFDIALLGAEDVVI